jgi:hypothetical protein
VRAIVERLVKLPKYGCADLLMIEAGRRDHGNRLSVDQPSKKPIRRLAFCLILLARPERFERPTPWFVAKYSIQLSYGRLAVFEREIIPSWLAPLKHYFDQTRPDACRPPPAAAGSRVAGARPAPAAMCRVVALGQGSSDDFKHV